MSVLDSTSVAWVTVSTLLDEQHHVSVPQTEQRSQMQHRQHTAQYSAISQRSSDVGTLESNGKVLFTERFREPQNPVCVQAISSAPCFVPRCVSVLWRLCGW